MKIADSVLDLVGGTPLVRLRRLPRPGGAAVAAKLESRNPGGSVKDRIALAMIEAAERTGRLRPGSTLVEPTSGNTGIGVACAAVARGYRCIFTMPETMTLERRHLLRALGCVVVLTPGARGMRGAIERAEPIVRHLGERAWMPRQFDNPANPDIHYRTTGPEIWEDTGGRVDILVSGVGTGVR